MEIRYKTPRWALGIRVPGHGTFGAFMRWALAEVYLPPWPECLNPWARDAAELCRRGCPPTGE